MGDSLYQRSFAGGELAPVLHARADQSKYSTGAKTIKNFVVRREGGVSNRPGLRFISACKTITAGTKLMRFVSTIAAAGYLIEMGAGYFRFYNGMAPVTVTGVTPWNSGTNYIAGDIASSGGVNYYCILANINEAQPNATYWYAMPAGNLYEIPTPYSLAALPLWNQSGSVITLTHPSLPPMELRFFAPTRWTLTTVSTSPVSQPPTAPMSVGGNPVPAWDATVTYQVGAIVANGGSNYTCILSNINQAPPNATYWTVVAAGTLTRKYVITTVLAVTLEESIASASTSVAGFLAPIQTAPNALTWTPPAGLTVDSYNIYEDPYGNGVLGLIGSSATAAFNDIGFTPDFSQGPPVASVLFANPNDYPTVSAYYQQRRFFANTNNNPDSVFGSRTGFSSNFGIDSPLQDDDAVTFRLAGNNFHPVRHLVAIGPGLLLFTDGGEWTATGGNGPQSPITPNSIMAIQQTYVGAAATVRPVVVGDSTLYTQARGSILRDLTFSQQIYGWAPAGRDLTVYASHLFESHTIVGCDFQQIPDSIVWVVRDDGVLLGLTYLPDQDLWAWHRHETWNNTTMDTIEDVCVVPEAQEDGVYVIVGRTVNGATVRNIERLNSRIVKTFNSDAFYVDSGLSYHGTPARVFSGLSQLEGQVVAVVADGKVIYDGNPTGANAASFTVTSGTITLPAGVLAIDCHIGLAIRYADLVLLDIDLQGSNVRGKQKAVHSLAILIDNSSRSFWAGKDATSLVQFKSQAWQTTAPQATGQYEVNISTGFTKGGSVMIRQTDPLPLTIIGVLPNVEVGGL